MIGVYIHIPFCKAKCLYCDFYSTNASDDIHKNYIQALKKEMASYNGLLADSLYFGGGSPSLLSGDDFYELISATKASFALKGTEITTEANPSDLSYSYLENLLKSGINRISIGVQSLLDKELSALGRRHTADQAIAAVRRARNVGFTNISIDLMLGIPHQTIDSLKRSLSLLETLELDHISAYMLKLEQNTPFGQKPPILPDDEQTAELYLTAVETLKDMGFIQYEISNFARKGFTCKHNLKYWKQQPYIGLGASAHSYLNGKRFYHLPNILDYIQNQKNNVFLENGGDANEWLTLALRLNEGISLDEAERRGFSKSELKRKTDILIKEGLALDFKDRISLTPKGFLLSNSIILYYLD